MLKAGLFNTMMFVGNPDNYLTCGLLTIVVAVLIGLYRYRSFSDHDKEKVKDDSVSNMVGFILAGLVWPITWFFTFMWCMRTVAFFVGDANWNSVREKLLSRIGAVKRLFFVWRDTRKTRRAIEGKSVQLNTVYTTREHKIDLEM